MINKKNDVKVKDVMIDDIIIAPETQHRANHSQAHIANLIESISEGDNLTPITIIESNEMNIGEEKYYLVDGYHRLEAHILSGIDEIKAKIINVGNKDLAIELSLSANAEHAPALPRNADDLKKACTNCCEFLHRKNKNSSKIPDEYISINTQNVADIVHCSYNVAQNQVVDFNNNNRSIRNRKIYGDLKGEIKISEIAEKYGLSEQMIRKIKKDKEGEDRYEKKRPSGWSRSRRGSLVNSKNGTNTHGKISNLKHIDRHSYADDLAERDIINYLINLRMFDGANSDVNKTNMYIYGGQVDIIGTYELVEVKKFGTRANIFQAIGQIITYSLRYPNKQKVIACLWHDDIGQFLKYDILKKLDIKLLIINSDGTNKYMV
ncbi:ParB/RepB/Spo0J family partition protein [Photobacterium carnosum]|uniref:sulfiredoxin n=1 Tax=Photobacterium carnosum TaxID=2023717 RepID=A0A2N4UQS9_9GAMM|nr:ParB/RepB/Spo0J family partition protein [Photobacterium carnosum]PLC57366.1 hypothetical protein CIK00_13830 [Photobacterium carnosum]